MPFCTDCGNNLNDNAFCTSCGAPAPAPATSIQHRVEAPDELTTIQQPVAAPDEPTSLKQSAQPSDETTSLQQSVPAPETSIRSESPAVGYLPPPDQGAYAPPLAPVGYTPKPTYPPYVPEPRQPRTSPWTPAKVVLALGYLVGLGAIGFLLTYFLNPLAEDDRTIPPPLPQLASSSSQTFDQAPDPKTGEGEAFAQLRRIAAQDRAALQSSQQWRAQLASSPATESSTQFLARYQETIRTMPNSLLAWSGDWPQSYAESSRSSWVILSDFTEPTTQPVLSWCAQKNLGCWAKRLSDFGTPQDNTDHPPADPSKN